MDSTLSNFNAAVDRIYDELLEFEQDEGSLRSDPPELRLASHDGNLVRLSGKRRCHSNTEIPTLKLVIHNRPVHAPLFPPESLQL